MNRRKINLLMLTTSYPLDNRENSGIFVKRLVDNIAQEVDVNVLTPGNNKARPDISDDRIIIFSYAPRALQKLANTPGGIPGALQNNKFYYLLVPIFLLSMFFSCYLNSKNRDLIHANWSICGLVAGIIGKIRKIPVITTLRGEDVNRAKNSLVYKLLLTACIRLSENIVCVSDSIQEQMINNYINDKDKFIVIVNGVNDELLTIQRSETVSKGESAVKLITVGSLIKRKGIDVIIKAVNNIKSRMDLKLIIVGEGPELNSLQELVKFLDMEGIVLFEGGIEPDLVSDYLAASDIFILASHSEGRPNVILEAMAAGMPIIASDIEGINELVEDNKTGLLFKDGSPEELMRCIEELLNNSNKRVSVSAAARDKIIKNKLLWTNTGEKYIKLYSSII